jgi:hypothetical protein
VLRTDSVLWILVQIRLEGRIGLGNLGLAVRRGTRRKSQPLRMPVVAFLNGRPSQPSSTRQTCL